MLRSIFALFVADLTILSCWISFSFFLFREKKSPNLDYSSNGEKCGRPGVNFTNILHTAFTLVDPKSIKKIQLSHQYLFTLLGFESVKAACRMLMKLSPAITT